MSNEDRKKQIAGWLLYAGQALIAIGLFVFFLLYYPIIAEELGYAFRDKPTVAPIVSLSPKQTGKTSVIVPVDANYSIVIPKIGANVRVVIGVDPFDAAAYRKALADGIAQAKGTKNPGESGNAFFFAHSSDDFMTRGRYNTVFYLLDKLDIGDRFTIAYQGKLYDYHVFDKKTLASEQVEYLNAKSKESTVTLMTCWPPGTDMKRLLVFGVMDAVRVQ